MKNYTLELDYDAEGDILYVLFQRGVKSAYQSLMDNIVLRFNPVTHEPIGLTLIDFSVMAAKPDGSPSYELDHLAELPDNRRAIVLDVVSRPPMNRWLHVKASSDEPGVWRGSILQPQTILDLLRAA